MALTKLKSSNLDPSSVTGNVALSNADLDATADYLLVYDASASELKKILVEDVKPDLSAVDQSIIPDGNEVYDLGTPENKWRDLYLSAGTIHLGGAKISEDADGNVKITDSAGTMKRMVVKEVEFDDGYADGTKVIMQRDAAGRIGFFNVGSDGTVSQTDVGISTSGSANGALDTIAELAAAIGNNPNYASDMEASNINMAAALVDIQDRYIADNP